MNKDELEKYVLEKYDWSVLEKDNFCQPILATRDGVVIDGAHRAIAARALGKKLPVIYIDADIVMVDPNELDTWLDRLVDEE